MKNIPEKIYLQIGDECDGEDFNELSEVSWCKDKIYDNDIEFERKDNVGVSDAIAFAEWISGYMNKDSWFRYHAKFRKWYVPGKGHFTTVGLYQEFKDSQPQKKEV